MLRSRATVRMLGRSSLALLAAVGLWSAGAAIRAAEPRFFADDPLWVEPETADASGAQPVAIGLIYDLSYNLFGRPGDPAVGDRAQNLNTVDEVPDSGWYTNRAGRLPLAASDVARGPDTTSGPLPGRWSVSAAKSDGVTPGFTIKDAAGTRWFIKFDPPGYRGMATGTEVVVTKLMWALGYNVPENHVARLVRPDLDIAEGTMYTPPGGTPRPMRPADLDTLLARADRDADGSYRVIAGKQIEGRPIGPIRFYGTRPDDPNDLVAHENRRELRGYGVFSAWFNHVDAKAGNSFDVVVDAGGRSIVRHYLIDFGSTLGSASLAPREHWEGYEYMVQPKDIGKGVAAFGFYILPWRTASYYEHPAIGRVPKDNTRWKPEAWRPRVPNAAFIRARADDTFWAARKAAAIADDLVDVAVAAGQFGDAEAEAFLARAIKERRDAIVRAYLPTVNPIVDPVLGADGVLTFRNAAVDARVAAAPGGYVVQWAPFDNVQGSSGPAVSSGPSGSAGPEIRVQLPAAELPMTPGAYLQLEIAGDTSAPAAWQQPVVVHFRRSADGWTLVGLQRQR